MSCYLRYLKKTCDLKNKYFYEMIAFSNILKCINKLRNVIYCYKYPYTGTINKCYLLL